MTGHEADEHLEANRKHWNELVAIHVRSRGPEGYDLEGFKDGRTSLHSVELDEVGDVRGKTLLHLQCHFGMDTLSWARRGAQVTGADFSEKAIDQARSLAAELKIDANFVLSSLTDLPKTLRGRFDIVFTSYGVLNWLSSMREWARIAANFLRPGGFFYVIDAHPFARVFRDEWDATDLQVSLPYWRGPGPLRWEGDGSYADKEAHLEHRVTFEWGHTMGDIVNSIVDAGLRIDFLHEFPFCTWDILPFMDRGEDRYYRLKSGVTQIPLLFSIKASKPSGPTVPLVLRGVKRA